MLQLLLILQVQMSDKKSQHIQSIQQALAEFDIDTQVKRVTIETMDAYMLGNKQAFQYIKQWETKFIQFEARLAKAQTYYHNIQISVNSKVQVTNSLSGRLEKFAQQFWANIKQSTESLQQVRKNYMNLVKEAGVQAATLRAFERDQKDMTRKIDKIEQRMIQQTVKLTEKIHQTQQSIITKNNERRSEAQEILEKISHAKSEMDSKTEILNDLCKDLSLYKDEKISINSQIATLHQQLSSRVQISQFNKIRVYIDNSVNVNAQRINEIQEELNQQINQQKAVRQRQVKEVNHMIQILDRKIEAQINEIKAQIQTKYQFHDELIKKSQQEAQQKHKQNQILINENKARILKAETNIQILYGKIEDLDANLSEKSGKILQVQSNIQSINYILKNIEVQNNKRGQELAKLRVDTDDKGDIGDQVQKLAQKLLGHDEVIRKIQDKIEENAAKSELMNTQCLEQLQKKQIQINKNVETLSKSSTRNINQIRDQLLQRLRQIEKDVEQKNRNVVNDLRLKIDSIKDKFDFLETLSKDMQIFKKTFQEQLEMNDQLNKQVKQKMDRMFGMFTKLKSDSFLKIETLAQDIAKNVAKLKQNAKSLQDISMLLSQYNEFLTVLLSVGMWNQFAEDRESPEEYKVASMLEGWILQATKQKIKYRGEYTTKKSLLQLCLQQHVKNGDKIKGGLIQNGKDIFGRIAGGSEDYQQSRRRSISRKKQRQSQLPKVYR